MKRSKRFLGLFLAVLFVFTAVPLTIVSASGTQYTINTSYEDVLARCYAVAQDLLREYYEQFDLGAEKPVFSNLIMENDLSNYLDAKADIKRYIVSAAGAQKENYSLYFTLMTYDINDGFVNLVIKTEASFNYVGLDVMSGYSEASIVKFSLFQNDYVLSDWYILDDFYDSYVRGEMQAPGRMYSTDNIVDIANSGLSTKQNEFAFDIIRYFENEYGAVYEVSDSSFVDIQPFAAYSLNKSAIKNYALNNASSASPSSGGAGVSYYDFSAISGAYDCTNFVSHALLAGGAVPYDTGNTGISSTGWYYRNINNRSSSWSGVPFLHDFLTSNTTKGPYGTSIPYAIFDGRNGNLYNEGDIMQFYSSSYGDWRHSTIVTGFYSINGGYSVGALVTGRTNPTTCNYNQKSEEVYPGQSRRIIKLTGYYN